MGRPLTNAALSYAFADPADAVTVGRCVDVDAPYLRWLALQTLHGAAADADTLARGVALKDMSYGHGLRDLQRWIAGAPAAMTLADACLLLDLDVDYVRERLRERLAGRMPPMGVRRVRR